MRASTPDPWRLLSSLIARSANPWIQAREPRQRIAQLQTVLFLRQGNRQDFSQSTALPRRIGETLGHVGVHIAELRQHFLEQLPKVGVLGRQLHFLLRPRELDLRLMQAILLLPPL